MISYLLFKCLDKGQLQDFGHPYDLIVDSTTIFHDLIKSLESAEKKKLIDIAKNNSLKKEQKKISIVYDD